MIFKLILTFLISELSHAKVDTLNCPVGSHLVHGHSRRAYIRYDGTPVSATFVSTHCRENTISFNFWNEIISNKRPTNWPDLNKSESSKNWSTEEKIRALDALEQIPSIFRLKSLKNISRMKKSIYEGNVASGVAGSIVLYDKAFDKSQNLTRILIHEIAHEYYRTMLTNDQKTEFNEASGWYNRSEFTKKNEPEWKPLKSKFVEPDGQNGPDEDFANNVEYLIFNSTKLQVIAPTSYEWLMNHFGDRLKLESNSKGKTRK